MVKGKLLDQTRHAVRVRHLTYRTEQAYVYWIKNFVLFHDKRHPIEMGDPLHTLHLREERPTQS